jgi:hypothetical protein
MKHRCIYSFPAVVVLLTLAVPDRSYASPPLLSDVQDMYPAQPTSIDRIWLLFFAVCISDDDIIVNVHDFTIDLSTKEKPTYVCIPEPHAVSTTVGPLPVGTYVIREVAEQNGQSYIRVLGQVSVLPAAIPSLQGTARFFLAGCLAAAGILVTSKH